VEAPPPVPDKKTAGDAVDFQSTSELTGVPENNEKDTIMEEGDSARTEEKIFRMMMVILLLQIGEEPCSNGKDGAHEISTNDGEGELHHATEDTFLQTILTSAGDSIPLFTSWEPGHHVQFIFNHNSAGGLCGRMVRSNDEHITQYIRLTKMCESIWCYCCEHTERGN